LKLSDFYYDLPEGQIAQEPVTPRDSARLLVVDARASEHQHRHFRDLDQILRPTDVLVTNVTKVFPARLRGHKRSGGKAEVLLLAPPTAGASEWRTLVRGPMKPVELVFEDGLTATMVRALENGEWLVRFSSDNLRPYLDKHGQMPLPPYIKRPVTEASDTDRYQTVFAKSEGAVAAPTAGFHFTPELLGRLEAKGVRRLEITLHVGWGTFRPVRTETIEAHKMLPERFDVSTETASALTKARGDGRRPVAVGTTVVRTLERVVQPDGSFNAGSGETNLFIYPGYPFKAVDALITNFHLPDSTPLLLACAFYAHRAGKTDEPFTLRSAYQEAIAKSYRFYSYGDAMVIQ
jgi:S-adenosylmethionine:tRNA ribosyltransferase-isomerase